MARASVWGVVILWTNPETGILAITVPVDGPGEHESDEEWLERIASRAVPEGIPWRVADRSVIPADRTWREAWVDTGSAVVVDMPRARDLHLRRIRHARQAAFADLDREVNRYLFSDRDRAQAAEGKRQHLRDLPQTLDLEACRTPEELLATWPAELGEYIQGVPG